MMQINSQFIKKILLIFSLLALSVQVNAQLAHDKLPQADPQQSQTKAISGYREAIMNAIIVNDTAKVKDLFNHSSDYENDFYLALYPEERWLILLWSNNFDALLDEFANVDTAQMARIANKILPIADEFPKILYHKATHNNDALLASIQNATNLTTEDKTILRFFVLDYSNQTIRNYQEKRNDAVTMFLADFPQSRYELYARYFIRYQYRDNFAVSIEIYMGSAMMTGMMQQVFDQGGIMGVGFVWAYRNFLFHTRCAFGSTVLHKGISSYWKEREHVFFYLPEISVSRKLPLSKNFSASPFLGAGSFIADPALKVTDRYKNSTDVDYRVSVSPIVGIDLGWQCFNQYSYRPKYNRISHDFFSLNLRYSLQPTAINPNASFDLIHTITFGLRMGSCSARRVY